MDYNQWVKSGKNYSIGVSIYKSHPLAKESMVTLFSNGESRYNKQKLETELKRIFDFKEDQSLPPPSTKEPEKFIPAISPPSSLPDEVARISNLRINTYKLMSALHQECCGILGNSQKAVERRFEIQCQIHELDLKNTECWNKLDHYAQFGVLPAESKVEGFNPENFTVRELVNIEKTLPTYISKYKKQLTENKLPLHKLEKIQAKKVEYELQLNQVIEFIDGLGKINKA